jgi:hypothetical protein
LSDPPTGYVVHTLRGRLRVRVPDRRRDTTYIASVAKELADCPGVKSVDANAHTGSLLIVHNTNDRAIAEYAANSGLLNIDFTPPAVTPSAAGERWLGALSGANRRIAEATAGHSDLAAALATVFLVLAVIQMARGQIVIPALTALWYALEALSLGRQWRPDADKRE